MTAAEIISLFPVRRHLETDDAYALRLMAAIPRVAAEVEIRGRMAATTRPIITDEMVAAAVRVLETSGTLEEPIYIGSNEAVVRRMLKAALSVKDVVEQQEEWGLVGYDGTDMGLYPSLYAAKAAAEERNATPLEWRIDGDDHVADSRKYSRYCMFRVGGE